MPGVTPPQDVYVGESIPLRYSFLSLLKDFQDTNQSLTALSVAWVSQTPARATFDIGSGGLVTSPQGLADGIADDAVIGRFTMVAPGLCTVTVSVDAINPTATYVGVITLNIVAIPSP